MWVTHLLDVWGNWKFWGFGRSECLCVMMFLWRIHSEKNRCIGYLWSKTFYCGKVNYQFCFNGQLTSKLCLNIVHTVVCLHISVSPCDSTAFENIDGLVVSTFESTPSLEKHDFLLVFVALLENQVDFPVVSDFVGNKEVLPRVNLLDRMRAPSRWKLFVPSEPEKLERSGLDATSQQTKSNLRTL